MEKNLQYLVREAFNIAYSQFKSKQLNEGSLERGNALAAENPVLKTKADEVLGQIETNPNSAYKYPWDMPTKSGLSMAQMNYIIDKLGELYISTRDEKYKNALSIIFSPTPERETKANMINRQKETMVNYPQLYWNVLNGARAGSPLEQIYKKNPDFIYEAIIRAWARLFKGGTINQKKAGQKLNKIDAFDNLLERFRSEGQGFAGGIVFTLINDVKNQLRAEAKRGETFIAPPKSSNGKDMDFGDDLRDSPDSVQATGEKFEDDPLAALSGAEAHSDINIGNTSFEFDNYQNAIKAVIQRAQAEGVGNPTALLVFQELMLQYMEYDEITAKNPELFAKRKPSDLLRDLITKNKKFNDILKQVEAEYEIPSIANTLFPIIDRKAHTELGSLSKQNRDTYPLTIKSIIKKANAEGAADIKSLLAFEGFFLDDLSYSEIVEENPGSFKNDAEVKDILDKLLDKNIKFKEIVAQVSQENGLSNVIDAYYKKAKKANNDVTGAQWISKAGKEMIANKNKLNAAPEPEGEEDNDTGYLWEKFLAENLDKIMERTFKRLENKL